MRGFLACLDPAERKEGDYALTLRIGRGQSEIVVDGTRAQWCVYNFMVVITVVCGASLSCIEPP